MTHTFAVRTYNIGRGTVLAPLLRSCQFALGNEFGDQLDLVRDTLPDLRREGTPFGVVWDPSSNPGRKTPIFYSQEHWRLRAWRLVPAVEPGQWLGRQGAGSDRTEEKYVLRARFQSRINGASLVVANMHATPSAFSTTGPERVARKQAWEEHVETFFRVVQHARVPVVGGGDLNATVETIRRTVNVPEDWRWIWTPPTKGPRRIDLIGATAHPLLEVPARGTVTSTDSDHRSPRVEFGLRGKR